MRTKELLNTLEPRKWADTNFEKKIELLKAIQSRTKYYIKEFSYICSKLKSQEELALKTRKPFSQASSYLYSLEYQTLLLPILGQLESIIDIYSSLVQSFNSQERLIKKSKSKEEKYDILIHPHTKLDKALFPHREDFIRVKGKPTEIIDENPSGIIAIFGSNDYSSSIETINALFLENCAVLHSTYHNSNEVDHIWEDIFSPLIKYKALCFCNNNCAKELISYDEVNKIYFIGGDKVIKKIQLDEDIELTAECGGNSPFFVVPPERKWSKKELEHQAMFIITQAKLNASAISGRSQTIFTSNKWQQKHEFLREIKRAVELYSPSMPYYFPSIKDFIIKHNKVYPASRLLRSQLFEQLSQRKTTVLANEKNEIENTFKKHIHSNKIYYNAMTLNEISLDTLAQPDDFLNKATEFANKNLDGALSVCIAIDDQCFEKYHEEVTHAIDELKYGSIGVNTLPPLIFINPYLNWGGNEADRTLIHGKGNFGNLFKYSNIEKSLSYCNFLSETAFSQKNKEAFVKFSKSSTRYHAQPNIANFNYMLQLSAIEHAMYNSI